MKAYVCRTFMLASLCSFLLFPSVVFAQNTIHVPSDVPNIQTAVFDAQNGDIVVVAPGYYFDSINFQGKNITVMSSDGAAVTTVDSGSQPAAQFLNNENNGAVLKGFTFVNGTGIQIFSASPVIEDNVITGNQSCQAGGISLTNSSAIVRGNTITNNVQFCQESPAAGGISVDGQGSVQILNNTISGNQTAPGVPAGAIFTDAIGTTTITNNKIQNNVTDSAGGGIYSNGSNVIIAGNLITGNSASMGGGIQIVPGSNAIVVNNTVALNRAQQGAQLQLDGMAGTVNLFNNIFYDLTGNGAIFCSMTGFTGFPLAWNNDAISFAGDPTGSPVAAYTGSCSDQNGLDGNVQVLPQFVDSVNGDFHLSPASPLVDAGNSGALDLPAQDLDGNPRIAAGSSACLPFVDIGAYEVVFNSVGSATLAPSSTMFGEAFVGVPNFITQPVTLTGTGGCAQVTSITTSSDYQQTNNCSVLRAGDSCTIQVTFAPTLAGVRTGALKVNLLAPAATLTSELSGLGLNSASVTPTELKFGIQAIQTSQFQSVNIFSNQGQPLLVTRVSVTGDFQQFNTCSQFALNSCFVSVQFTPTAAGPRTGVLTIVSNLGTYTVPLSGDGAAPVPSLSATSLTFPSQTVGTGGAAQAITLTNNGTTDLVWNSVFSTPDFQVTPAACNGVLSPGTSCTFNVAFAPTTVGPITGSVEIDTNGGPVTASLTGTGTVAIATLSPQLLNFANQPLNTSSATQAITVTNISGAPLQLTSLTAPDNFLATSSCPAVLAMNASCEIDVLFGPVSSGPYGGFITLGTSLGQVTAALTVGSNHVFHVPSEVFSIQQAISLAQDGDTILVAPGTYFEQINFQGKAITIASTAGAAVTTLDGEGFMTPVMAFQNEGPGSVLKGFTITHSPNSGVVLFGSSPTIQDNIITENSGCSGGGGGLLLQSSSAIIKGNTISNNTLGNCFADGAGIWIGGPGNVQVLNNLITGNQNSGGGSGGGIAVSVANATIISNTIQGNASNFASGGGIALINGGKANVIQNLITGNSAALSGGGVYASAGTFPGSQLVNNTIADNFAPNGSGLFVSGVDSSAVFVNNIITDSSGGSAVSCDISFVWLPFAFNDVFSSAGGASYGACQDLTSLSANISQDPQFIDSASGDYKLQASSPAIDAGTNSFGGYPPAPLPERDLEGNGRILPGNADTCTGTIDLGAYEFATGANGTPGPLPASWDFGSSPVGFQAAPFVFNQSAQGCVGIASIKTTGDFQQTNTCNNAVSSFSSCSISVSFNPQHLGSRTGSLIVDYGASAPTVTVALTGQGINNPPVASPASLNFGPQAVGTSSAAQVVTVSANAPVASPVNAIWISGDFSETNQCSPSTQPAATGACVIYVVFTPTASGNGQGTLTVSTTQGTVVVPLTGTVNSDAIASFSQSSLSFGSQQVGTASAALNVTLSNTGGGPLSFGIGLGPDFSQTNNCPQPLPAGSVCMISVVFQPTVPGPISESLTLSGNSNPPAAPVTLTGTGVGPVPSFSPTSLTFAAQLDGTTSAAQSVSLSNTGNAPLTISGMAVNGDFSETDNCGTSLAGGASCTVNVTFTPTARGARTGTVTLLGNFTSPAPVVNLAGTGQAYVASITPASFDFGAEPVNTTTNAQIFTYKNTGDLTLAISNIAVPPDFNQTNNCPASLAVGASCSINVSFAPRSVGTQTASLTVAADTNISASVTGNGVMPTASLSPASLDFGHQRVGTASAPQLVTVTNTGAYAFFINQWSAPGSYQITNNCPSVVNPGMNCTFSVVFAPAGTQSGVGVLTIGGDFTATPSSVSLSGTADASTGTLSPTTLTFANQVVGTTSASQTVTLFSTGTVPINLTGIQTTGDFSQTNNCGTSLAPGSSCIITVAFTPTAHGQRSGTLILSGDFTSAAPSATLSGTGTTATAAWSPASLTFANQLVGTSSSAQAVSLTNTGDGPLTISGITATGDFAQTNNCGDSVAANSSCVIQVTFRPTATGTRSGSLSISSNSVPSATAVSLSGTGVQPAISISPVNVAFGDQVLSTTSSAQTITVSNPGTATLHVSSNMGFSGDPDFSVVSNNCAGTAGVAPGASCAIQVDFIPQLLGTRSGTLTIMSDAPASPTSVALSGNGVNAAPTLSPSNLSFGNIFVGKTSGGKTVKLTSNGSAALTISSISVSAGFIQTNNCPASLSPGTSCNINVSFKPLAGGAAVGTLSIVDNGFGTPQTVSLSGNGLDFSVSASPASATITAGQKAGYTVTVSPLGGSYNSNVALSCSGVPTGVKCSFSPSGVSPGSTSINSALTVSTTSGSTGTPPGSYAITINGTANGTTHSTTVGLVVD